MPYTRAGADAPDGLARRILGASISAGMQPNVRPEGSISRGLEHSFERTRAVGLSTAGGYSFAAFGSQLGTTDLNGQISLCQLYVRLFEERLIQAREWKSKYAKLYLSLGVLGGLLAWILFL